MEVPQDKVVRGKLRPLDILYGKWDDNYSLLYTYQAKLMRSIPGSILELKAEENNDDVCFMRFFVALKPCTDGFL